MSYSLKIERPDNPISLEEWTEALDAIDGIRLTGTEQHMAQNPVTGQKIGLKAAAGDVEVFDAEDGQWHPAVMWRGRTGAASFNSRIVSRATSYNDLTDPIWLCFAQVARLLSAQISGEEGEIFDLDTAQPIRG